MGGDDKLNFFFMMSYIRNIYLLINQPRLIGLKLGDSLLTIWNTFYLLGPSYQGAKFVAEERHLWSRDYPALTKHGNTKQFRR